MKAVILAGGSGTRFWPKSRRLIPKQCLKIISNRTMVEEIVSTLKPVAEDIYISTGRHLEPMLRKILPDVRYIIEPVGRNTAACIGLSLIQINSADEIIVFETSDHYYSDKKLYLEHLKKAAELAKDDKIVLMGIKPNFPNTGFGYIKQGKIIAGRGIKAYDIDEFREKPDAKLAMQYLKNGNYLWNAGIFVCKSSVMLNAIRDHMPELYKSLEMIKRSGFDESVLQGEFEKLESISIDYGVMEKLKNKIVIRGEFPWSDIGDWRSLENVSALDQNGNVVIGQYSGSAKDCIIVSDEKKIEAENIVGLVIVDTPDCLLVCKKTSTQEVKRVTEILLTEPALAKYAENIQSNFEFRHIDIASSNVSVKSSGLVATIGLQNIIIDKGKKVLIGAKK